jgi:NADP-dependent 3-hydroxy acid dehydrogenase YdfG
MIEVNLLGAITTTEVFLDQLKDGGGDIINISSVAGRTARSGNGVYAATKWGIDGQSDTANKRITDALGIQDTWPESESGDACQRLTLVA